MFVVGGDGKMYALDLGTGATLAGWPVTVTDDPAHEHTYGGVTPANGFAYAETASYCDLTPYHGKVIAVDVTKQRTRSFFPAGPRVNGGGIWGPGGVSVDPATGHALHRHRQRADQPRIVPLLRRRGGASPPRPCAGCKLSRSHRRRCGFRRDAYPLPAARLLAPGGGEEQVGSVGHL